MSDDWSLKDVEKYIIPSITIRDNKNTKKKSGISLGFYEEHTIEDTLRKKLIEDIDSIDCTNNSKLKKWEIIEEVLEIIDKRFGKDDSSK